MKFYNTFLVITFFISLIACSSKNQNSEKKETLKSEDSLQNKNYKSDQISFKYSDSVFSNMYSYGVIYYDKKVSGIKKKDILKQYPILYVSIDENAKTFEDIKKTKQNDFIDTIGNGVFHFKYKFNKIGLRDLKLVFEELIIYLNDSIRNDTLSLIRESIPITLPVHVLDSSSIIGYKNGEAFFVGMKKYSSKRKDSARILREARQKIDSMKRVLNN